MATGPLVQVPSSAVDIPGLSISTTPRSPTNPRPGGVYDNVNLAAAAPIHFHPMTAAALGGGSYMMLNAQRWSAATPSPTDPGYASTYTVDNAPSWVLVHAATGGSTMMNSGYEIPLTTTVTNPVLVGALSVGVAMLYTLISTDQGAIVQHWHNNTAINTLNPVSEELIPEGFNDDDTVVFDAGIDYSLSTDPYMVFYGQGNTTGRVYMARKRWSRVGDTLPDKRGEHDGDWEFFDGTGWVLTEGTLGAVQTSQGPMLTDGPMSFAHYAISRATPGKDTGYVLTAATLSYGSLRSAQIYQSLGGRPWTPLGAPIPLGTVGSTYLGGTVQFQSQLGANPTMVDPVLSASAVPYLVSTKLTSGSTHKIAVTWGLVQLPRQS